MYYFTHQLLNDELIIVSQIHLPSICFFRCHQHLININYMTRGGFKQSPNPISLICYRNSCNFCKIVIFFPVNSSQLKYFSQYIQDCICLSLLRIGDRVFGFGSSHLLNFMSSNSSHTKEILAVSSCRGTFSSSHNPYNEVGHQ